MNRVLVEIKNGMAAMGVGLSVACGEVERVDCRASLYGLRCSGELELKQGLWDDVFHAVVSMSEQLLNANPRVDRETTIFGVLEEGPELIKFVLGAQSGPTFAGLEDSPSRFDKRFAKHSDVLSWLWYRLARY